MKQRIQHLQEKYLCHSSFMKFYYKNGLNLYLDQNYATGEITIVLCKDDGHHFGKLRYSLDGKLTSSELITHKDLNDLVSVMDRLWKQGKYEAYTISRDEFNASF